jgi:hypothetical protein
MPNATPDPMCTGPVGDETDPCPRGKQADVMLSLAACATTIDIMPTAPVALCADCFTSHCYGWAADAEPAQGMVHMAFTVLSPSF